MTLKELEQKRREKGYTYKQISELSGLPEETVIYDMASPSFAHQVIIMSIAVVIQNYIKKKKGRCKVLAAAVDVQLDCDNKTMVQPDIVVLCDKKKNVERCIMGAPDFVVEVLSKSTRKKDMTMKLEKYRNAGVREYWMIDFVSVKMDLEWEN